MNNQSSLRTALAYSMRLVEEGIIEKKKAGTLTVNDLAPLVPLAQASPNFNQQLFLLIRSRVLDALVEDP